MSSRLEEMILRASHVVRLLGADFMAWQLDRAQLGGDWEKYR